MFEKVVQIPKFLQKFHGESAPQLNLVLTYAAALVAGGQILYGVRNLAIWKMILLVIIFADIGGGAVSNLTTETNQYYQKNIKKRVTFLLFHLLYPALLILVFPYHSKAFIITGIYTVTAALIVNALKGFSYQQLAAAAFFTGGILLTSVYTTGSYVFAVFAPLFLLKLVVGFAVRRPVETETPL